MPRKKGNVRIWRPSGGKKSMMGKDWENVWRSVWKSSSHPTSLRAQPLHNKASALHLSFIKSAPNEPLERQMAFHIFSWIMLVMVPFISTDLLKASNNLQLSLSLTENGPHGRSTENAKHRFTGFFYQGAQSLQVAVYCKISLVSQHVAKFLS